MQRNQVSTWCVLTLSAEQAAIEEDFAHLDVLMNRREELLLQWESEKFSFTDAELVQINTVENRLSKTLTEIKAAAGAEMQQLNQRSKSAQKYRTAA